jgi:glycine/D-amino acid oxidase-like deaminating enzyme
MSTDVIIIGGGIAGLSLAARLAPHAHITLLEGEEALGHHASGRSAALFEPRYGAPAVVELSLASEDFFMSAEGILSPRGLMMLGRAEEEDAFRHDAVAMSLDTISPDEARAMVPILNPEAVAHAAYAPHAWDIDTDLLMQRFAREARAEGTQILTGQRVTGITRQGDEWLVTTAQGQHRAGVLVNAAGAWADQVAALAGVAPLGFTPYRRSMARIPAPGGHDLTRWPMMFGAGESWYAKPDAGALIVSPADEDLMEPHDAWADDMVLAEGLARYEAMMTEPVTRVLANWAGLRTFSRDRNIVIGHDAAEPSFFWLAGQGGQGFQSCPAASQLAADLLCGRATGLPDRLLADVSPRRFG